MKCFRIPLAALLVIFTMTACNKKHSCVCTVKNITTNEIIDTRDFSYRGNDSRTQEQKEADCDQTGKQIDEQNNNSTVSDCVVS